jgi:hypothetical protein
MIHTQAELDTIRNACRRMVTKRAAISAGVSVVPIPGADLVADVGILTKMLPAISERSARWKPRTPSVCLRLPAR